VTAVPTTTDASALYRAAVGLFDGLVESLTASDWTRSTPCPGWTVRDLVNHVTVEDLWAVELFDGHTVEQVGSRLDGDQLGAAPAARWREASSAACDAAGRPSAATSTVHLSFGDVPGAEYAMQLFADHLVHSWDLATALGRTYDLPDELVRACLAWFAPNEHAYRSAGLIGPRSDIEGGTPADRLLAAFGRMPFSGRPDEVASP
jgi:uncharacterized protein (TIGR03086 family)